jgi:hypothetical protein
LFSSLLQHFNAGRAAYLGTHRNHCTAVSSLTRSEWFRDGHTRRPLHTERRLTANHEFGTKKLQQRLDKIDENNYDS